MKVSYTAEDVAIVEMPATSVAVMEHRGDPMRFVTASQVYEHLEKTVDRFEDVANELQAIVIEHV